MMIYHLGKFFWKKEGGWLNLPVNMVRVAVVTFLVPLPVLTWPTFPPLLAFSWWAEPRMILHQY